MTIAGQLINQFQQNNTIIISGKDKLMSGELILTGLGGVAVPVSSYIGKKKRELSQEMEGIVSSFQAYVVAEIGTNISTFDLIIAQSGEKFIVGAVTTKNDNTTINGNFNEAAYLYADLEIYIAV